MGAVGVLGFGLQAEALGWEYWGSNFMVFAG